MTTVHHVAFAALVACCACRESQTPPPAPGDVRAQTSAHAPTPADGAYCVDGAETPAGSVTFGKSGARAPVIAAAGDDYVVGWVENDRVMLSSERAASTNQAAVSPSDAKASSGLALAGRDNRLAAAWVAEEPRRVEVRLFEGTTAPVGPALVLSGGGTVGPPAIAPDGQFFVVTWVEDGTLRAARVTQDGRVDATTSWSGSNERPYLDRSGTGPKPSAAPTPAPKTAPKPAPKSVRGGAHATAPLLHPSPEGLRVSWWGRHWMSDHHARDAQYSRLVRFPDAGDEPVPLPEKLDRDAMIGARSLNAALEMRPTSSGQKWDLALRLPGGSAALAPFASFEVGPAMPAVLDTTDGVLVAWPTTELGGVALMAADKAGSPGPMKALASGVSPYEAGVALASGRAADVRVAYVACGPTGAIIRVANLRDAHAAKTVAGPVVPKGVLPEGTGGGGHLESYAAARGTLFLGFQHPGRDEEPAKNLLFKLDAEGALGPSIGDLGAFGPRCGYRDASPNGIVAWSCCEGSMCAKGDVRVATLSGSKAVSTTITSSEPKHRDPAVAMTETRAAVAVMREDHPERVVVYQAAVQPGADVGSALRDAKPIELPPVRSQGGGGPTAAFAGDELFVAYADTPFRLFRISPNGAVTEVPLDPGLGTDSGYRLAPVGGGIAFLTGAVAFGESRAELVLFGPDGKVRSRHPFAHGAQPYSPVVVASEEEIGAAWFDMRSISAWVAFFHADGTPKGPPLRVNGMEVGGHRDTPALVPLGGGRWRVFWREQSELFSAVVPSKR